MSATLRSVSKSWVEPGGGAPVTGDGPPVIWDVEISIPAIRMVVVTRAAEWLTPPAGVDPELYAHGQLGVFLAGWDPKYPKAAVDELAPGTLVRCRVLSHGTELASVTRSTPEPEASER